MNRQRRSPDMHGPIVNDDLVDAAHDQAFYAELAKKAPADADERWQRIRAEKHAELDALYRSASTAPWWSFR